MGECSFVLELPYAVKVAAERLAEGDGVSLNQFIAAAVAEKIGALGTVDVFLAERTQGRAAGDMLSFLKHAPDAEPVVGDGQGDE